MNKLLFLITHNDKGGAQDAIVKISRLLNDNYDVSLIALYERSGDTRIKSLINLKQSESIFKIIYIIIALFRYIRNNNPDIIISFLPLANLLNGFASLFFRYKSIISHRNPVSTYSLPMRIFDYTASFIGLYDKIICNSRSVEASLCNYPKKIKQKTAIVNNFVEETSDLYNKNELETLLQIKIESKFCIAVGRLSQQKRFDVLINAFKETNFQILIAGDGELKSSYENLAGTSKNIIFLGHCSAKVIKSLLKLSFIYLQPSEYEGQSNSLLEAIQHNCIIISSDIPPQREVLINHNEVAGVLLDTFDPAAWRKCVEGCFDGKTTDFIIGKLILRKVYSKENVKSSLENVFMELK